MLRSWSQALALEEAVSNAGEKYLQFPLCALAFFDDERDRLRHIISFGVVEAGHSMLKKLDPELQNQKAKELAPVPPEDYLMNNSEHVAAMVGAKAIGIIGPSVACLLDEWYRLTCFRDAFQKRNGRDVGVRVAVPFVLEAWEQKGITWRELAILCAVYSVIGAKDYPVRITRKTIQCRMLGYKSPSVMQVELGQRTDGALPLSCRQINYVLDKLHERKFFSRARANERQTFYSHRLSQNQLETKLVERKSYSAAFHKRRIQGDSRLMQRIKQLT